MSDTNDLNLMAVPEAQSGDYDFQRRHIARINVAMFAPRGSFFAPVVIGNEISNIRL